jgi:acetyl esterase/lipase
MVTALEWVTGSDAVCVSIEYRLAPEYPGNVALEECYTGLKWMGENLDRLGIDPSRVMIAGQSAGGGLAAGVALLVRDKGGPALCAQLLMCPQLDDRNNTVSSRQFKDKGIWSGEANVLGWECTLPEKGDSGEVSIYVAPARATDLSGLPPAYIDVGSAEVFRDEDVGYALKLWECGVQTELHVWPGGFHVFELMVPTAELSRKAVKTRTEWVQKILG